MHSKILALLFLVGVALGEKFGKTYVANLEKIKKHNELYQQGKVSYRMAVNQFTSMTDEEFHAYVQGLPPVPEKTDDAHSEKVLKNLRAKYANYKFKDSFSWVDEGIVTSVKNQGQCGSCTAFACTGAVESCFIKKSGEFIDDLAEQFLVDCAYDYESPDWPGYGAQGCSGAWPQAYMGYLYEQTNGQHVLESAYPYTAHDGNCKNTDDGFYTGGAVTGQNTLWGTNEDDLKMLLVEYGPVVTSLDASYLSSYSSGVFSSLLCCNAANTGTWCTNKNNHAVLVVGYGSEGGKDYWLVKNSWAKSFGEDGYFKIKRGTGHCGFGWQCNTVPLC